MSPADLFPTIQPWVENLANVWPAYIVKPQFASWEVLHIISLIVLGGVSVLINLRLIGVGMMEESPSEMYRNLKLWMHVGVIGIVVTGVLIGMANAERLYNSNAFTVKMLALFAGIVFTYGVSAPTAKADGVVGAKARAWGVVGLLLLGMGVVVFATSKLINPGLFHVLTAAALIVLFVMPGKMKWVFLIGLLALWAAQTVGSHIIVHQDDFTHLDPLNKTFAWIFAAWIFGFAAYQMFLAKRDPAAPPLTQAVGYVSILVWIVAAAAGRWIAFA